MVAGSSRSVDQVNSVRWTCSLLRTDPEKLPLVLAVIGIGYCISLWGLHNPFLALLPTLLVISSVSEYLFPIHYCITQKNVSVSWAWNTLEMNWEDIRHIYDLETGLKFSPLSRKNSQFEAVRGIRLWFDNVERRDQVLQAVALWRKDAKENA